MKQNCPRSVGCLPYLYAHQKLNVPATRAAISLACSQIACYEIRITPSTHQVRRLPKSYWSTTPRSLAMGLLCYIRMMLSCTIPPPHLDINDLIPDERLQKHAHQPNQSVLLGGPGGAGVRADGRKGRQAVIKRGAGMRVSGGACVNCSYRSDNNRNGTRHTAGTKTQRKLVDSKFIHNRTMSCIYIYHGILPASYFPQSWCTCCQVTFPQSQELRKRQPATSVHYSRSQKHQPHHSLRK